MNQINDGQPNACCIGCRTQIVRHPYLLGLLLRPDMTIREVAKNGDGWLIQLMRMHMDNNRWEEVLRLTREHVRTNSWGSDIRLLHKGFGQVKLLKFIKPTSLTIDGTLEVKSVLQVIGREDNLSQINELMYGMAVELTEPHLALRMHNYFHFDGLLQPTVIFDMASEGGVVYFASNHGITTKKFKLPGSGNDLNSLLSRMTFFLRHTVTNWRAVMILNVWGLGSPQEIANNEGMPPMLEWIRVLREFYRSAWIVIGAVVPNTAEFNEMCSIDIIAKTNVYNEHRDVYFVDVTKIKDEPYSIIPMPVMEDLNQQELDYAVQQIVPRITFKRG